MKNNVWLSSATDKRLNDLFDSFFLDSSDGRTEPLYRNMTNIHKLGTYEPDFTTSKVEFRLDACGALIDQIDRVIFNDPATIIYWKDGEKTVVKAQNESFDPEKGFAMAIAKYALGNKGNFNDVLKKYLPVENSEK